VSLPSRISVVGVAGENTSNGVAREGLAATSIESPASLVPKGLATISLSLAELNRARASLRSGGW
jgi:hypothetical protein